jgi:phenylalanyl-tRNA synthetase beta chain
MKIPYRWLREFVETEAEPKEVAERLTMAGIEVASLAAAAPELQGVLVAEVISVEPHPVGRGLTVCEVVTGERSYRVVCGAPNVRPGVRAALAPPGAVLPGGRRIGTATIRGTLSEGMLCSEAELGLGEDAEGILLLEAGAISGDDLVKHLGLDDTILEVEVTPNRPDCLSVAGLAREVSALTGGRLREPLIRVSETGPPAHQFASVLVEDADLCPRYGARVVTEVTVAPSPPWLARRLRAVGQRPINNVVDVTNYALWELGHPLHAFDADQVSASRVVVRRARPGESLTTLDGQTRALTTEMLVIADAQRAIAVGGVMGGANSEVGPATRTVLLEAAYFKPGSVRRTAKALGLSTEASYRFERGADIEAIPGALDRAAELIARVGGGRVASGWIDVYPTPQPARSVELRLARIRRLIGACPPRRAVGSILEGLGFSCRETADGFRVDVPSRRRDVTMEDDLVEEVTRVWGYGQIPSTVPSGALVLTRRPRHVVVQDTVRRTLAGSGLSEAVTLSLANPAHLAPLGFPPDDSRVVRLQNPLAADRSVLRTTLLAGLLEALQTNVRRQTPDVRLFEVGRVFEARGRGELPHEDTRVGLVLSGLRAPRSWFSDRGRTDVLDAKGLVEGVVSALGRGEVRVGPTSLACLEDGRGAALLADTVEVGFVGELHPRVIQAFDVPGPVMVAELSLDRLDALPGRVAAHRLLARFPAVARDLAVVVSADVPAAEVTRIIETDADPCLRKAVLFDVYQGDQVGAGRKSLAYGLLYQADDRTLTDTEVTAMHGRVVERLRRELEAEVRGPESSGRGDRAGRGADARDGHDNRTGDQA